MCVFVCVFVCVCVQVNKSCLTTPGNPNLPPKISISDVCEGIEKLTDRGKLVDQIIQSTLFVGHFPTTHKK